MQNLPPDYLALDGSPQGCPVILRGLPYRIGLQARESDSPNTPIDIGAWTSITISFRTHEGAPGDPLLTRDCPVVSAGIGAWAIELTEEQTLLLNGAGFYRVVALAGGQPVMHIKGRTLAVNP